MNVSNQSFFKFSWTIFRKIFPLANQNQQRESLKSARCLTQRWVNVCCFEGFASTLMVLLTLFIYDFERPFQSAHTVAPSYWAPCDKWKPQRNLQKSDAWLFLSKLSRVCSLELDGFDFYLISKTPTGWSRVMVPWSFKILAKAKGVNCIENLPKK